MKIIITRQFDKIGDNFLDSEEVLADVRENYSFITIELDEEMFLIPKEIFTGITPKGE